MWRFFAIFASISMVLILSFYIHHNRIQQILPDGFDSEPFNNFRHFNDLEKVENGKCAPYVLAPKQADNLEFIEPIRFSCNSPMEKLGRLTTEGVFTISKKGKNQEFTCLIKELVKIGEHPINGTLAGTSEHTIITIEPEVATKIPMEQFVVLCQDPDKHHIYNKTFFNFAAKSMTFSSKPDDSSADSLIILTVSGMTHNQGMRHLTESLRFAAENEFQSFSMFNQETSSNFENSQRNYQEVWNLWKQHHPNCPTFLHTDFRNFSTQMSQIFHTFQPDFQPDLYNSYNRQHHEPVENCITDGSEIIEDDVTLWSNFSKIFSKKCHFSILHLTEIAGHADGRLVNLDEILRISLEEMLNISGIAENANIVIMSDGGVEKSEIGKTESGKIEGKYGLFLIRLSNSFRRKFPREAENIKDNVDKLITNSNVGQTLRHLIFPTDSNCKNLTRSLLETRLSDRRCEDVGISEKLCICSNTLELPNEKRTDIFKNLQAVIEAEVSTQKCLSKAELVDENSIKFRASGNITFFKFQAALTTGTVKLQKDTSKLRPTVFKYTGKARISTDNSSNTKVELVGNLKPNTQMVVERICSEIYYHKIHEDFEKN